jgi:hypothetical protein
MGHEIKLWATSQVGVDSYVKTTRLRFCLLLLLPLHAVAQVQIALPKSQFASHEQIDVAIENTGQKPVSFCVEFGHWSFKGDGCNDLFHRMVQHDVVLVLHAEVLLDPGGVQAPKRLCVSRFERSNNNRS